MNKSANEYLSQDDQNMSQAIEASLNYEMNVDLPDDRTLADRLRHGDRLVVLPTFAQISQLIAFSAQSLYVLRRAPISMRLLFFMPCSSFHKSEIMLPVIGRESKLRMVSLSRRMLCALLLPAQVTCYTDARISDIESMSAAHMVWTLLETFVNMELSRMNELDADAALQAFGADPWNNPNSNPGDLTFGKRFLTADEYVSIYCGRIL